jgi:beta-glucosidase
MSERKPHEPVGRNFLWGVATSAFQSEGGYNGLKQPQTNWATAEHRGDVSATGRAAEFWIRYEEDFALCRKMGLNAFRMGIEWSRIQPTRVNRPGPPPPFDRAAMDHYAAMIASCRRNGLEPVITLHHFVHPAWLGPDPWLKPGTPALFRTYVAEVTTYINGRLIEKYRVAPIRRYITINEPNMLVLNSYLSRLFPASDDTGGEAFIRAYSQLIAAHILAYNAILDIYERSSWHPPQVTMNNYCSDVYWSDKVIFDLMAIRERGVRRNDLKAYLSSKEREFDETLAAARIRLHKNLPYWFGVFARKLTILFLSRLFHPETLGIALDAIYQSKRARVFDYLGLDYYDPFAAHAFRLPILWDHEFKNKSARAWIMNTVASKWWDWRVLPKGLRFFCRYYSKDFDNRQILIAENGMALRRRHDNIFSLRGDRMTRSQFLRLHVHEVQRLVGEGVPLIGYLHWSLFDNYEWGTYTPRFGLFSINYRVGPDRLETDPTGDRPSETYASLIREASAKNSPSGEPITS